MIPKIVHLIWFGKKSYPPLIQKCIQSWYKILPDYEIKLWTEDTFDLSSNSWVKEAYESKKYAFVADYVRFYVLYKYGGIYIETDIEVLKSLDKLLCNDAFIGFTTYSNKNEDIYHNNKFTVGVVGSNKHHSFCEDMMNYYENKHFSLGFGNYNQRSVNSIIYEYFISKGLNDEELEQCINNVHIYPPGYFLDMVDRKMIYKYIDTAYSLHYGGLGYGWGDLNKNPRIITRLFQIYMDNYLVYAKVLNRIHFLKVWNYIEYYLWKYYVIIRNAVFN